jgi:hypothetical protein
MLGAFGFPLISHDDGTTRDFALAYGDAKGWGAKIEFTEGETGPYPSLASCGSGFPYVSYRDWLSYWQYRYDAPRLLGTRGRFIRQTRFGYPSGYRAEGRFLASMAYYSLLRLLSK